MNLATIGVVAASIAAFVGAIKAIFTQKRTVTSGCTGILFLFNKPRMYRGRDQNGNKLRLNGRRLRTYCVFPGRVLWWLVPAAHRIVEVPSYRQNTVDTTISAQRPGGLVSLTRIILNYDVIAKGAILAARIGVDEARETVANIFHDIVNDVLELTALDVTREEIRQLILDACAADDRLKEYGISPNVVTLPELTNAPFTQLSLAFEKIFAHGGTVVARSADVKEVVEQVLGSMNGGNGDNGYHGRLQESTIP